MIGLPDERLATVAIVHSIDGQYDELAFVTPERESRICPIDTSRARRASEGSSGLDSIAVTNLEQSMNSFGVDLHALSIASEEEPST